MSEPRGLHIVYDIATRTYTYVPVDGVVILATSPGTFKAHWDSGWPDTAAVHITLWDGEKEWDEKLDADHRQERIRNHGVLDWNHPDYTNEDGFTARWDFRYQPVVINATDADRAAWEQWKLAKKLVENTLATWAYARKIRATESKVEVFKGRKVPKGEYEVVVHRMGNYGPYVDLRDAVGAHYKYVAVGNVRVIPDLDHAFANVGGWKHADPLVVAFARKFVEDEKPSKIAFAVLADALDETNTAPPAFTAALRFFATTSEQSHRFSMEAEKYAVERHNEFRSSKY